jgi:predicted outer membrane lipoprotein
MVRAIVLGLILFVAFGTIVPLATEYTEASARSIQRKQTKKKRAKKYRFLAYKNKQQRRSTRKKYRRSSKRRNVRARKSPVRRKKRSTKRRYTARKKKRSTRRYTKRKKKRTKRRYTARKKKRSTRRYTSRKKKRTKRRYTARKKKRSTRRYTKRKKKRSTRRYTSRKKKRSIRRKAVARKTKRRKRVRKYTSKWWANYRAAKKRKKAVAKRKRSMRLRSIRLAKNKKSKRTRSSVRYSRIKATPSPAPKTRLRSKSDVAPMVTTGDVSMDVVGTAIGKTVSIGRRTAVGGMSTTTLRRSVIDQMIRDNGWVENDYHKEIGGKKVYVVVAKAPGKSNRVESRTYYFTESDGRVYRVASRSSSDESESAKQRSEIMIRSITNKARPQQAQNK